MDKQTLIRTLADYQDASTFNLLCALIAGRTIKQTDLEDSIDFLLVTYNKILERTNRKEFPNTSNHWKKEAERLNDLIASLTEYRKE